MSLTDEHWKCIKTRAFPVLVRRATMDRAASIKSAQQDENTARLTFQTARNTLEDAQAAKDAAAVKTARADYLAAQDVHQEKLRLLEEAQQKLQELASFQNQLDLMQPAWSQLSDESGLLLWVEEEEISLEEEALAAAKEATTKVETELAEKKAALAAKKAAEPTP